MKALILAGGMGTRLRPLLPHTAKPMAEVAGRPFLEYLIAHLARHGLREIVICTGYLGDQLRDHFADGRRWGLSIRYCHEERPLGTAGAIKHAEALIGDDPAFLATNGDSFFAADLRALIDFHHDRRARATVALAPVPREDPTRYGRVELDEAGRIRCFVEKGAVAGDGGLINGGIYLFDRRVLGEIPAGVAVSLEREVFPRLIGKGFYGLALSGFFVDIGLPASYQELRRDPRALTEPQTAGGGGQDADSSQGTTEN
jgi:NDP-sugar pyrophosphorylase family protein